VLKLTNAYLYFKNFLWTKTRFNKTSNLTPKIHYKSPVSKYHFKNFPGPAPDPHSKGREGREREGKMKQGRRGKKRGWDGRVRRGSSRQIKFYDYSTVHS
jgi:hypothetical protein